MLEPQVWAPTGWQPLRASEPGVWSFPSPTGDELPVRVRYALDLDGMSSEGGRRRDRWERRLVRAHNGVLQISPLALLLRPKDQSTLHVRVAFDAPAPLSWVSGIQFAEDSTPERPVHRTRSLFLEHAPYTALGVFEQHALELEDARVELVIPAGEELEASTAELLEWVESSWRRVAKYYDRPPVPRLLIALAPQGRGSPFGLAQGNAGASIRVSYPRRMDAEDLRTDWVLTHEMIHTGMPGLAPAHDWLEEGMATYVEAIARAREGVLDRDRMWRNFRRSMPYGQPDSNDGGLDETRSWGRVYWGGALFCFWVDVELRRASNNAIGLEQALRGIQTAGGDARQRWSMQQTIEAMEAGSGLGIVTELYDRVDDDPIPMPLNELLAELGVISDGSSVRYDDEAPLAHVRRALDGSAR